MGKLPFSTSDLSSTIKEISSDSINVPPDSCSPSAEDLIKKLLVHDQKDRLGYEGSSDIMSHDFFIGVNWNHVIQRKFTSSSSALSERSSMKNTSAELSPPQTMLLQKLHGLDDDERKYQHALTISGFSYDGGSINCTIRSKTSRRKSSSSVPY